MTYEFKAGDRVKHKNDAYDEGTFVKCNGEYSQVIWDIDGDTEYNATCHLYLTNKVISEQDAIMLLLGLGYTVSKNS